MPQYEIEVPGYGKYRVESPTELTDAQAYAAIQDQIGREPKPKTGVGAAVSRGLEGLLSRGRTAVGALTGNAEEAARAGIARGEDIQRRYANQTDMGRVTEAYNKDGILSAGRELASQIPYALAEQAPNLGALALGATTGRMAGARLGAMAGSAFGPIGTAIGGGLGAFAPSYLTQLGGDVERRAQEGQPANVPLSAAAAVPQAALDMASQYLSFGGKLIQKLTGIPTQALFSKSAAQVSKLADERLMTTLAKGTVIGGAAEIPTEVAQQMIERAQAGLSLTTPDAIKEYGETMYQSALLAPLGAVGRLSERGGARQQVAQTAQEESAAQAAQQQQVQQAQEQQQAQLMASPEYAQQKKAEYDAAVAERQRLSDASKAPEGADPIAVADAAEAAKALKEFDKNVMSPLVEEARRVRALHPQLFPAPTPPAPAAVPTATPATPAPTGAEAAAAVAPTPTGEETDTAYVAPYVQFLMQTPKRAQQIVDNAEEIPGLTPQQSETVRSVLTLQLKPTKRAKKAPAAAAPVVEETPPAVEPTAVAAPAETVAPAVETTPPVAEETPAEDETPIPEAQPWPPRAETTPDTRDGQYVLPGFEEPLFKRYYAPKRRALATERLTEQQLQDELKSARRDGRKDDVANIIKDIRLLREERTGRYDFARDQREVNKLQTQLRTARQEKDNDKARAIVAELRSLQEQRRARTGSPTLIQREQETGRASLMPIPATKPEPVEEDVVPTRGVSEQDVQELLDTYSRRGDLNRREQFLLKEIRDAESRIMDDPEAREIVAEWLDTDVGVGVGEATRYLRAYLGIGKDAEGVLPPRSPRQADFFSQAEPEPPAKAPFKPAERAAQAEKDQQEQAARERLARLPGRTVSFEERRKAREARETGAERIAELDRMASDATLSPEERKQANDEREKLLEKRHAKQATKDATRQTRIKLLAEERAELKDLSAQLDQELLNKREQAQVAVATKRSAEEGAALRKEKEAPKREKLQTRIETLRESIAHREKILSKAGGVTVEEVKQPEQVKAESEATVRETRAAESLPKLRARLKTSEGKLADLNAAIPGKGKAKKAFDARVAAQQAEVAMLTDLIAERESELDVFAGYTAKQTTRRASSPLTKTQSSAPGMFRTGEPERSEKTKTSTTSAFESTKPRQRNVPISKKDIKAANVAAPSAAMGPAIPSVQQEIRNAEALLDAALGKVTDLKSKLREAEERVGRLEKSKGFVGTRAETAPVGTKAVIPPSVAPALENAKATVASLKTELAAAQKEAKQAEKQAGMEAASRLDARRTNTPLSAQAVEMAQDGRILNLADELAKNGSTPAVREAAAKLRPLLMRTKLVVDAAVNYDGESVAGLYSPRNNTITMHPEGLTEEDVLHEMGHAATDYVLLADPATLTADQRAARKGLEALHASVKKSDLFKDEQGIADVREFAAEVLSNNDFRNKMDSVGKPTKLLQRILGFFKRMLGMQTAMSSKEAQALVDRILAPSRKLVAKEAPSLFRKEASFTSKDALSSLAQKIVAQPAGYKERTGSNVMLKLEMNTTDMRAGLREALKAGAKAMGNDKLFTQAMYSVIKADQKMPMVMAALSNGPLKLYEDAKGFKGVTTTGKDSAKEVFDAISKIPDTYGDSRAKTALATSYMIAQRAANKGLSRLDTGALGVDQQQLAAAMRAVNADPALKNALESVRTKYNAYNAGMIKFLADTGALPAEKAADLLKYGDYVPFYRVRSDGVAELVFGNEQTITIGDIRYQPHLAQLKGGEEKILPLDQSIYRNTILLTDKAMTNMAARNVAYALQTFGKTATKDLMPIHRGQGPTGPDIIRFSQEPDASIEGDTGQRWLQVRTEGTSMEGIPAELVVKSLEGAHLTLPAFLKWGQVAGDLLRAGVTRSPIYLMRQLFRDPMAASFTTGLNYNPLRAIFKANKEFLKISAGTSETGAKLIEKGLVQSGIFTGDPDDISKFALQLASGKDLGAIDKLFAMADKAAMNADTATRSLVYDNALANGLSEVEADMATMESMNFYKRGLSPTVQYASRLIPFFNSQIQGLNVLYKAARGQMPFNEQLAIKRKFMNNAMLLMGVGVAYAMAMDDDEYYRNAKPKDRYSNFFLHLPGVDEPIKLPIPYEAGWFFSAAVAAVDAIKGETDGEQQLAALKDMFLGSIPGFSSKFVPQIFKPAAEVYTNKKFYNGQDLESTRLQNLTTDQRYNRNTTELAKAVSKAVPILSPIQIEHIVSGYLGQLPIMAMAAADGLFTPDQSVEEPTRRTSELPLVGTSFQRKYGGADADVVYKLAEDALQSKASLDSLLSTGKAEDAKEYRQEHMAEIAVAPIAKQYQTFMGTLRKQEEIIRASKSYTADQKRERIDNIDKQRQLQSEKFLQAIKRAEAAVGA